MNQMKEPQHTEASKQLAKIIICISHKTVFKTTAIVNMAYLKAVQGYRVAVYDTDGIPAAQMFLEACVEETEKRIIKNKSRIKFLTDKGRMVSQEIRNQLETDEFYLENRPAVISKSLYELAAEIQFLKRDYGHYDYIFIDVPAKVLDSQNKPIKEIKRLMSFSDLVITPYKGDSQYTFTAVTVSDIIENLKCDAENNGGKFKARVRSVLAFDPARIKANTKAVNAQMTLTDTSTTSARLARNEERKALKEQDRIEQMKAHIKIFDEAYGNNQKPISAPMVFRSVYPNQFNKGESIYTASTESAKIAQAEFTAVVDAIIAALDETDTVEIAETNTTITN
ncbi:MAG: hypothetical protein JHC54_06210 [Acinetobacter sp.]|nr:hypothetical protein [Acinetobacter sp.]